MLLEPPQPAGPPRLIGHRVRDKPHEHRRHRNTTGGDAGDRDAPPQPHARAVAGAPRSAVPAPPLWTHSSTPRTDLATKATPECDTSTCQADQPFDYPPEEERKAVDLVLKQMEIVAALWAPGAK